MFTTIADSGLVPPGAFDTHVHIFDPANYPYAPSRAYTPISASHEELDVFTSQFTRDGLPMNPVLVQGSPYGCLNDVLKGNLRLLRDTGRIPRGIAVIDTSSVTLQELSEMHECGVRGIRINTEASGARISDDEICRRIARGANTIKDLPGWVIQVFVHGSLWRDHFSFFEKLPVPVIADHFGGLKGSSEYPSTSIGSPSVLQQPGLAELTHLARQGRVFVKLSGAYRASSLIHDHFSDLEPLIRHFVSKCPDQLIYASDWPHTGSGKERIHRPFDQPEPFRIVDQAAILEKWRRWVGSEQVWNKIMIGNPRRLYSI